MIMQIKIAQSFSIYGEAFTETGEPFDLTGYTLASQLEVNGSKVSLDAVVVTATEGAFRLDGTAENLPNGQARFDVRFTKGNIVDYSQTEKIELTMAVTQ